ncbi:MAG: hypothetical protein GX417_01155 [Clostridiales bacterium]|nr:hypothetical protein [Clostridiales bacterium]
MFTERYSNELLAQILLPRERCHPFPTADEREEWEALPADVRAEMIARGEILLRQKAPFAPIRISADRLLLDDDSYEYMDEAED